MPKDVIIALDFASKEKIFAFLEPFQGLSKKPFLKIGMEAFYGQGPDLVRQLKDLGFPLFLDLKLHDIPTTVERAMARLAGLGVEMTNVHAAGGLDMLRAARSGFGPGTLLAVTQLTSISQEVMERELWIDRPLDQVVLHYAKNAQAAGLDGVVSSPLEAPGIHQELGAHFLTVTPGIRFDEAKKGDQKRVTTPARARELGSDYIVVGRPITRAEDPFASYQRTVQAFLGPEAK